MGALSLSAVRTEAVLHRPLFLPLRTSPATTPTSTSLFAATPQGRLSSFALRHAHRPLVIPCRAQVSSNVTFHFDSTSITIPFPQDAAVKLSEAIENIIGIFQEKEKATRPRRWEGMDFRCKEDGVIVEIYCNPNAYANFFQSKALVTVNDGKVKIVTEALLSAIKADVEQFITARA